MGDFYWDSPNRQISPNVADMQRNLMTLGGMGTPPIGKDKSQSQLMKDFMIRALMFGSAGGVRANIGSSPTTNLTSKGLALNPNVNSPVKGGNLEGPIRPAENTNVKDINQHVMDILKDTDPGHWTNLLKNRFEGGEPTAAELSIRPGVQNSRKLFHNPRITGITGGKSDIPSNVNTPVADLFNPKTMKDLNLSHSEKYEAELMKQQLTKKGHDPNKLSMEEIMKILGLTEKD